jgi:hypothetical protein
MRSKHVPERTCVVCRQKQPKRELLRIVRTPEGEVALDATGRANGRGGYVCADGCHIDDRMLGPKLQHALQTTITQQQLDTLKTALAGSVALSAGVAVTDEDSRKPAGKVS